MRNTNSFQYQLDSLLKKRRMDYEQALTVYREAQDAYDRRKLECEKTRQLIERAEQGLRTANESGQIIDADEISRMKRYLSVCHEQALAEAETLRTADDALKAAIESMNQFRESIKTLEKHREGQQAEFVTEQTRKSEKSADDLWLARDHQKIGPASRVRRGSY